ncbi:MAG: hypothetical protein NT002_00875 [candidate division Zixibacteria bacterium]|jgi:hypothetical protein|nr:hypothetical protein [candidate division Zixibacteria bacterium]
MANEEIMKALEESGLRFRLTSAEQMGIDTGIVACQVGTPQTGGCTSCQYGCMSTGCDQVWCAADGCYNTCSAGRCTSAHGCYNWFAAFKPT